MAFTRFHDDPARIQVQSSDITFSGRYQLNAPGPGINLPFFEDPQLRLQQWGGNLQTNAIDLEGDLFGMTRKLNRDLIDQNNYKTAAVHSAVQSYSTADPFVEESRATHPAWTYRTAQHPRWEMPWLNPQHNLEKGFQENIQTRIIEKDRFQNK